MYRDTLADNYRVLLNRFRFYDFAVKVLGVGSVGTMRLVSLFMAADNDPLFLQVKQANASVLEPYAGKSLFQSWTTCGDGPALDADGQRHDAGDGRWVSRSAATSICGSSAM
jgi:hypothetical protein